MKLPEWKHTLVTDSKGVLSAFKTLAFNDRVTLDLETEGLNWIGDKIVGVGLGVVVKPGDGQEFDPYIQTFYLPLNHRGQDNLHIRDVYPHLELLCKSEVTWIVGANIKFDCHFLNRLGFYPKNLEDVQVMARLLRTTFKSVALDVLIEKEFQCQHEEWLELIRWCRKKENKIRMTKSFVEPGAFARAPVELVGRYCGRDVYYTALLYYRYKALLGKDPALRKLYEHVERPLIHPVIRMEDVGICVDRGYLKKTDSELVKEIDKCSKKVFELAGKIFDINSPKQLKEILVQRGVKPQLRRRKRPSGERVMTPSFDAITLEDAAKSDEMAKAIIDYREVHKLHSTYFSNMLQRARLDGAGRWVIHANIVQEAARTGRLSARNPNLTNLPREEE